MKINYTESRAELAEGILIREEDPEDGRLIIPEKEPSIAFNGVFFRGTLFNREDLSWLEKAVILRIDSYTTCFASNRFLAKTVFTTQAHLANILSKLREMGLIHSIERKGMRRRLVVDESVAIDPKYKKPAKKEVKNGVTP